MRELPRSDKEKAKALVAEASESTNDSLAESLLESALTFDPQNVDALLNMGKLLEKSGRGHVALLLYNAAIASTPDINTILVYLQKAQLLDRVADDLYRSRKITEASDKYSEALQCYDKALELDPRNLIAHSHRPFSLIKLGKYPDALEALGEKTFDGTCIYVDSSIGIKFKEFYIYAANLLLLRIPQSGTPHVSKEANEDIMNNLRAGLKQVILCYERAKEINLLEEEGSKRELTCLKGSGKIPHEQIKSCEEVLANTLKEASFLEGRLNLSKELLARVEKISFDAVSEKMSSGTSTAALIAQTGAGRAVMGSGAAVEREEVSVHLKPGASIAPKLK